MPEEAEIFEAPKEEAIARPSAAIPSTTHPRGLISPPLPSHAPRWKRIWRGTWRLGEGLYHHDAFQAAPAMAFHFFLSLLPLMMFLGYLVGSVARNAGVDAALAPILVYLPEEAASIVKHEVDRMANATALGPIAAIGFLWLASGGTHGLMDALEGVVGAARRPWWKKRLLAGCWVIATVLALTVASLGIVEWDSLIHPETSTPTAEVMPPDELNAPATMVELHHHRQRKQLKLLRDGGERALAIGATLAFFAVALAGFYWFSVSHPRRVKRRVVPGAVLAVGLGIAITWGFGLYVRTLTNYAVFYGSLAAVAVLLVWLWLASLAILVGAELNAQLEGLRD